MFSYRLNHGTWFKKQEEAWISSLEAWIEKLINKIKIKFIEDKINYRLAATNRKMLPYFLRSRNFAASKDALLASFYMNWSLEGFIP